MNSLFLSVTITKAHKPIEKLNNESKNRNIYSVHF